MAAFTVFDICRTCGIAEIHREPNLPETCPKCGKPWGHGRRLSDADWQVRLVARALSHALTAARCTESGRFWGLTEAGTALCNRITDAACADRWHYTSVYGMAVHLLSATNIAQRSRATKNTATYDRYRKRVLGHLDAFANTLRRIGTLP